MNDPRALSQELQSQVLETIRKSQQAITDAIEAWAEAVHSVTPSLPVRQPHFTSRLPKPGELVANAYDFAEQLLATQRKFAEDVVAAVGPVLAAKHDDAPAPKAKASSAAR